MELLDWSASKDDVLESFPMLEGLTESELRTMRIDCFGIPEDEPFVRAIDILLKRMDEGGDLIPA
ncbi:MAG TPA: hypothetical protein VFL85_01660 [Candidatus Saccharimonadales bacterium]|nr:hypothetical protein [Candidatus Saccharimonadales bacterium]